MRAYSNKEELQQKIIKGANTLADNVASTLGPRGQNVLLQEKTRHHSSQRMVSLSHILWL